MIQEVDGRRVFVVELNTLPVLLLPITDGGEPELAPYAQVLDSAIRRGTVYKRGKYAIEINESEQTWSIFEVNE